MATPDFVNRFALFYSSIKRLRITQERINGTHYPNSASAQVTLLSDIVHCHLQLIGLLWSYSRNIPQDHRKKIPKRSTKFYEHIHPERRP